MKKFTKTESIAEFLARGGKITQVPEGKTAAKAESVKSTSNGGPATIVTMDEADLYHGEKKVKKAKKKVTSMLDISALPEELRKKYVDTLIQAETNEEDEDE